MGIIIPESYSNVSLIFTCEGSIKEKVTSFGIHSADLDQPTPDIVADDVRSAFSGSGRPFNAASMLNEWTFEGVVVTQTIDGLPVIGALLDPIHGTAAADPPPSNVALLIKKQTALGGRKNRGRMYVPPAGVSQSALDASGNFKSGEQAGQQTKYDGAFGALETGDYVMFLFHSDSTAPTPITGFSVESQVATQRRRMR